MATYVPLLPIPIQLMDSAGAPLSSGTLEFYLSGTSTPTNLFSDNAGTSIGSSITLNASGYPESGGNVITLFRESATAIKIVAKDSGGSTLWTADTLDGVLVVLSSTANAKGASLIGVEDSAGDFTATTVEGVLAEIGANFLQNVVEDTTPQLGGDLDAQGNAITTPEITDFSITHTAPTISSGAVTFDCENGNSFTVTLTENITAITLSNPPPTGSYGEIAIKFIQDGTGSRTVAGWPAAVKWAGGSAPTITTTATTGTDYISLRTHDAGTTWYGVYSQDFS